jgi:hemolysin III
MLSFIKKPSEPVSGLSHFIGFLLSIAVLVLLLTNASTQVSYLHITALAIFDAILILLYGASSIYHLLQLSQHGVAILRRIDHAMIFILIAGTYTLICIIPLRNVSGWSLFNIIWCMAITGII